MTVDANDATGGTRVDAMWSGASYQPDLVLTDLDVVFRRQPKPVPARQRMAYRTALVVLVLSRFNQGAAKLTNLHTLMWSTRTARTRRMFTAWWNGRRFYNTSTERLDPDLQVTLNLAIVDGLIEPAGDGTRIRLADKGQELARLIYEHEDLLGVEKAFLEGLNRLSDSAMERKLAGVPQ